MIHTETHISRSSASNRPRVTSQSLLNSNSTSKLTHSGHAPFARSNKVRCIPSTHYPAVYRLGYKIFRRLAFGPHIFKMNWKNAWPHWVTSWTTSTQKKLLDMGQSQGGMVGRLVSGFLQISDLNGLDELKLCRVSGHLDQEVRH